MNELQVTTTVPVPTQPIINERKPHTNVYAWEAIYNDGTRLRQWTMQDGKRIIAARYYDIQRKKLVAVNLYRSDKLPSETEQTLPALVVEIQPGYRLIWRVKRRMRMIGPATPFLSIYMLGWQTTINDKNIQSIVYLYHDESKPGTSEDIQVLSGGKSDDELLQFELLDFEMETP